MRSPSVKIHRAANYDIRSLPVFGDHDKVTGQVLLDVALCATPGRLTILVCVPVCTIAIHLALFPCPACSFKGASSTCHPMLASPSSTTTLSHHVWTRTGMSSSRPSTRAPRGSSTAPGPRRRFATRSSLPAYEGVGGSVVQVNQHYAARFGRMHTRSTYPGRSSQVKSCLRHSPLSRPGSVDHDLARVLSAQRCRTVSRRYGKPPMVATGYCEHLEISHFPADTDICLL